MITPPVVAPIVAALWCRARRRPLVVDCHTGAFHSRRWAWARPLYRLLLPRSRAVLVHTGEALAWLGVPAVCSRLPAMEPYFPPDAVTYAAPGDPGDLAERIDALLRRPADAEAQGARASDIARAMAWEHGRDGYFGALGLGPTETGTARCRP